MAPSANHSEHRLPVLQLPDDDDQAKDVLVLILRAVLSKLDAINCAMAAIHVNQAIEALDPVPSLSKFTDIELFPRTD